MAAATDNAAAADNAAADTARSARSVAGRTYRHGSDR